MQEQLLPDSKLKLNIWFLASQQTCTLLCWPYKRNEDAMNNRKSYVIKIQFIKGMRMETRLKCNATLCPQAFYCFLFKDDISCKKGNLHTEEKPPTVLSGKSKGPVTLNNRGGCCAEGRAEHTSHWVHSLAQQARGQTHGSTWLETDRYEKKSKSFLQMI